MFLLVATFRYLVPYVHDKMKNDKKDDCTNKNAVKSYFVCYKALFSSLF